MSVPLRLELHARSAPPPLPTAGLIVARDDAILAESMTQASAGGTAFGLRGATLAGLCAIVRQAGNLPDPEPADGLGLRAILADVLGGEPGAGRVPPLERAVRELRAGFVPVAGLRDVVAEDLASAVERTATIELPEDALWDVADAACDIDIGTVTVVGFDDLSPGQWALLRGLATRNTVSVHLPYEDGREVFAARRARAAGWCAAADNAVAYPPTAVPRLERLLFTETVTTATDDVRLLEAAGSDVERRLALGAVLEALVEGVPPEEIAVVVPRLSGSVSLLAPVFSEAGIAVSYETWVPWTSSPLAHALVSLWSFACDETSPAGVAHLVAWLRSPYGAADSQEVDTFEAAAYSLAEPYTRGQMLARWEGEAILPARALRRIVGLRAQVGYLVRIGHERLEASVARAGRTVPDAADLLDLAALGALGGLVDQLPDVLDPPERRGRGAPGGLGAFLADLTIPQRVSVPGSVSLLDAGQVRGRRFRHVVCLGLESGVFPARPAPDPYLPDDVRTTLGLPPRAPGTSEAHLRFHAICAAAGERLTLVRRFADDDGREVAPSVFWLEVRRLCGELEAERHGSTAAIATRTSREQERSLARIREASIPSVAAALSRRTRHVGMPAFDRDSFRVTELEEYLNCGYRWFVHSVLNPVPFEPRFDAAEEGSFGHDVLERVYKSMPGEACRPETLARYHAAIDTALVEVATERRPVGAGRPYVAFCERLRRHLHRRLQEEADRGPRLVPARFEEKLSSRLVVDGAEVRGKSDRIDVSPDHRFVMAIDYKRSGALFTKAGTLQLPLYAEMAAEQLGAESAGGVYLAITNPKADGRMRSDARAYAQPGKSWEVTPEEWRVFVETARQLAAEAIEGIRAGRIAAPPANGCASWCGHGAVWR